MITQVKQVREFMRAFQQEAPDEMRMLCVDIISQRDEMFNEEWIELIESRNTVEQLDAITDMTYVLLGYYVAAGITPETAEAAFNEVHRSNMTKFWSASEIESIPPGCRATLTAGGRYIVKNQDGKVIKSPSYSPANLAQFVKGQA